ncbi:hypothetical protein C5L31_000861 [Secundilactobacillus malefermentans]|uniref:Uncharacterized protein n=1 Tax=Secundilactobacillus malefermentans TaxID=176292 RepID=A0A4R5NLX3_9LACO|nr:hypothetical protein C5L31_000861 [Secundilactobacillus malefermentans]
MPILFLLWNEETRSFKDVMNHSGFESSVSDG